MPVLKPTGIDKLLGWFGGVAASTPPNQPQRCILTDYFNNYNFSKLK